MSKIDDFLFKHRECTPPSLRNLDALERAFDKSEVEFPRKLISNKELPWNEFANWLSRKFKVTNADELGCWPRYDGGCWKVIRDCIESEDEHYDLFFKLYGEFRSITTRCCLIAEVTPRSKSYEWYEIEAWECSCDWGYLKYLRFTDGLERHDGFFASLEDLMEQSQIENKVEKNQWGKQRCL